MSQRCIVRKSELDQLFLASSISDSNIKFDHLTLRARYEGCWSQIRVTVSTYYEQAHADARQYFHGSLGLSLDPRGGVSGIEYPRSLPLATKKGYFGEVFCGMLAEAGGLIAGTEWTVPVFLFRLHQQAEEFLMRLITGELVSDQIPGRTGSDCLALSLANDGAVNAILAAEAKCYEIFNITKAREALKDLGAQAGAVAE